MANVWTSFRRHFNGSPWFRILLLNGLWFAAYWLASSLGRELASINGYVSLIWPASGVTLAGILLGGIRFLPGLVASIFLHAMFARGDLTAALLITIGVVLGPWIVRWLLHRWTDFSPDLARIRDAVWFIVLGAGVGPIITTAFGTVALVLRHQESVGAKWTHLAQTWWLGDAMGILVLAPFLLIWHHPPRTNVSWQRGREMVYLLALTLFIGWLVYFYQADEQMLSPRPWNFLVFPLVLLGAFRFGRHGAVTIMLITVIMAVGGTLYGRGPFALENPDTRWEQLWLFMAVVNISALLLGSALQEQKQARRDLDEHRHRLDAILASVPGMVYRCMLDEAWTMLYVSPGGAELTGHDPQSLLLNRKVSYESLIHPEDREHVRKIITEQVAADRPYQLSYRIVTRDGKIKWVWEQGTGNHESDPNSRNPVIHLEGVILDISDRKVMEENIRQGEIRAHDLAGRLQVLLRELDHRVKNNLAGLFSLLDMYARRARNVEDFAQALRNKLLAMKSAHELIADAGWHSVDLSTLLRTLAGQCVAEQGATRSLHLQGPTLHVSPRQVGPMAMVIQELFTNCVKHGAYSTAHGEVTLTWSITDITGSGRKVQLQWSETGGPPVTMPTEYGQGLSLIQGFCHYELAGSCRFHFEPRGFRCDIHWNNEP